MSTSATQRKTHADVVSPLPQTWQLNVEADFPSPLSRLDQLQISLEEPEPGGNGDLLFGSVLSAQPTTAFAIQDGSFSQRVGNILEVSFTLTINGHSYAFVGLAQGLSMKGFYTLLLLESVGPEAETEEGSWSAQAQPGPIEEEIGCPPKRAQRIPR